MVPAGEAETAAEYGAGRIFELNAPEIGDESAFAAFLLETIRRWGSQIVLAPATVRMRNIMPMLAWQLDAGLTADCTALRMEGEQLIQTRPAFGNSLMADIRSLSEIQMATVRPGTFRPEKQAAKTPDVQTITYTPDERVKLHSFGSFAQGKPLSQAEIIVAGGMGVGSKAGFEKLEALARKLGGSLGASRTAVEAGFAPYRCQVGMTGITVCPKLYIAVGISGAVQHLAGMSGSGKVVAINSDPKAPIFDYADYGIVGDWEAVVDKLLKAESFYMPREQHLEIEAIDHIKIAVCGTPVKEKTAPQVLREDHVVLKLLGRVPFQRETSFIIDGNSNAKVLTIGEAYCTEGNWAGFPPHKHDEDNMPAECIAEEIYYFLFDPKQGFAVQCLYTADGALDEAYRVKNDELVEFPYGYHTTVSTPGYQTYFLWLMAGDYQGFNRSNDPEHDWVK